MEKIERIAYLIYSKKLANQYIKEYIQDQNSGGFRQWESKAIRFNIRKLKKIIKEINRLLSDREIDQYLVVPEKHTYGFSEVYTATKA